MGLSPKEDVAAHHDRAKAAGADISGRDIYGHLDIQADARARAPRQVVLRREHPPQYDVVIDEAAFRRNTAPPEVLRGQLRYLISIAELDNVSVQWQLC